MLVYWGDGKGIFFVRNQFQVSLLVWFVDVDILRVNGYLYCIHRFVECVEKKDCDNSDGAEIDCGFFHSRLV